MYESPLSPWFIEREVKSRGEKLLAAIFCSPFFYSTKVKKPGRRGTYLLVVDVTRTFKHLSLAFVTIFSQLKIHLELFEIFCRWIYSHFRAVSGTENAEFSLFRKNTSGAKQPGFLRYDVCWRQRYSTIAHYEQRSNQNAPIMLTIYSTIVDNKSKSNY